MSHRNQLRFNRKRWALSQWHVAKLLGLPARSTISKHELGACTPALQTALGYELLFDRRLAELFPAAAREVESTIVIQAVALDRMLAHRTDASSRTIREFLKPILARAGNADRA